ncbi:Phosphoglycolate phosphatase [Candidatus Lokiarchaeum ossiferum]|uniref:Phosphoglycolate phosphatase n=1 Tax=Candidatus Lokiarchaeum ossiferum TaxID=2951803 RepID=A0ABY6HPU2_9ARCH|nr:Phosphoglycolate phosphatase [Candidatus Lokiarchaeum sp. B-35]
MNLESGKIGFIFDLDGTLLDNMDFFLRDMPRQVAQFYGSEFTPEMETFVKSMMFEAFGGSKLKGKTPILRAILKTAKLYNIPWYKRLQFLKVNYQVYKKGITNMSLIPGAEDMLNVLTQKNNFPIGICTTSSEEEIKLRFQNRPEFLDQFNGALIGRDTVKNPKPAPEGILKLSKKWGIPPNRLVMVGDFSADVEAGKNAGTTTIGVLSGFCTLETMKEANPDFIFQDVTKIPENLPDILNKIQESV